MNLRYIYVTGCIVCASLWGMGRASAQTAKKYPVQALREDFNVMRSALEKIHPSLYWYTPKDSMDRYFDEGYRRIDHEMTEREFFRLILPVLVRVKCGHTYPDMSDAYRDSQTEPKVYLPFELFLDGDRLFIVKNGSTDTTLRQGDEILKLGGTPVAEIARLARALQTADGDNVAWKNKFVEWFYLQEVYLEYYDGKPPFKLVVAGKNGTVRETEVRSAKQMTQPVKPAPRLSRREELRQERREEALRMAEQLRFRFTQGDSSAAVIRVGGFSYESIYGRSFYKLHRDIFRAVAERRTENLVIDLRGNSGGNLAIAEDLMAYLVDRPFRVADRNELHTPYLAEWESIRPYFEKQGPGRGFPARLLKRTGEDTYTFPFTRRSDLAPARRYRFSGNVYVITDGWVFSAGSLFVSSLRAQRKITVIGGETGGAAVGCSGGRISRLILPNTQLRVYFPHFRIYAVGRAEADGHGVIPDYPVKHLLTDEVQNRDPEMEQTFHLIKGR